MLGLIHPVHSPQPVYSPYICLLPSATPNSLLTIIIMTKPDESDGRVVDCEDETGGRPLEVIPDRTTGMN